MKVWQLEVEEWDTLSPAARVETTYVQRFGTRHQPMSIKVDTGHDPFDKVLWVKESVVKMAVVVDTIEETF